MKNQPFCRWSVAVLLALLPLASGCLQQEASATDATGVATNEAAMAAAATNAPGVPTESFTSNSVPEVDIAEAPVKAVATDKPVPANIRTNGAVGDVIKLAGSGVEESVMLAYVTNSASMFSLSAEEIIYLNDIGVPSAVVTAMLQHDQGLKNDTFWAQNAASNAAPAPTPAEVAPQAQPQPEPAPAPQPEVAAAPAVQPTYSSFYQSLSPYGTWVDIDGYGLCWQPTVVALRPSWRPYLDCGRWVYSDYGWYWASDYSWGWAPFHYGRWFRHHRLGWCWYPSYTWGPSWVSWRYTDGYCGWAPLPPCAVYSPGIGLTYWGRHVGVTFGFGIGYDCFSFVSWNHFHNRHLHNYYLPPDHAHRVYRDSVVSTRIVGNRNHVFNQGLPVHRVATATRAPVPKVAIHETSNFDGRGLRGDRISSDGKSLTAYRPRFVEANANATQPVKVQRGSTTRPAVTRNLASAETAPPGALKPVPAARTAPARPVSREAQRPTPAMMLASADDRPAFTIRPDTRIQTTSRPAPTAQPSQAPPAGRSGYSIDRASRQPAPTPTAPNVTRNWQPPQPTRSAPVPTTPTVRGATTRQSPAQSARVAPEPSRPSSSVANPYAPAPVQRSDTRPSTSNPQLVAPRYNTAPTPSYQPPARPAETPRYSPPPQRSYQAPARTYEAPRPSAPAYSPPAAPPQREYRAPTPSYQAPPAPSYSAPSRPSPAPSSSRGDSRPSSGGDSRGQNRGSGR